MFYKFARAVVKPIAFFLFRLKVFGRENEPLSGPLIICGNHISLIDPALIGVIVKRKLRFMAKAELFKLFVFRKMFKWLGAYPVHRGNADIGAIKTTLKILKDGGALLLFPEGTRVKEDESADTKSGVAMFANKTKASVLPIGLKCDGDVRIFKRIKVFIGKPIKYEELGFKSGNAEDLKRASEYIMSRVRELIV